MLILRFHTVIHHCPLNEGRLQGSTTHGHWSIFGPCMNSSVDICYAPRSKVRRQRWGAVTMDSAALGPTISGLAHKRFRPGAELATPPLSSLPPIPSVCASPKTYSSYHCIYSFQNYRVSLRQHNLRCGLDISTPIDALTGRKRTVVKNERAAQITPPPQEVFSCSTRQCRHIRAARGLSELQWKH